MWLILPLDRNLRTARSLHTLVSTHTYARSLRKICYLWSSDHLRWQSVWVPILCILYGDMIKPAQWAAQELHSPQFEGQNEKCQYRQLKSEPLRTDAHQLLLYKEHIGWRTQWVRYLDMISGIAEECKITTIEIQLPREPGFDTYSLKQASQSEIKSVEQGKKWWVQRTVPQGQGRCFFVCGYCCINQIYML